jgi:hypothetical protein
MFRMCSLLGVYTMPPRGKRGRVSTSSEVAADAEGCGAESMTERRER